MVPINLCRQGTHTVGTYQVRLHVCPATAATVRHWKYNNAQVNNNAQQQCSGQQQWYLICAVRGLIQ